jgi:hypothetical protein
MNDVNRPFRWLGHGRSRPAVRPRPTQFYIDRFNRIEALMSNDSGFCFVFCFSGCSLGLE